MPAQNSDAKAAEEDQIFLICGHGPTAGRLYRTLTIGERPVQKDRARNQPSAEERRA